MKKLFGLPGIILSVIFLVVTAYFISESHEASEKFRAEKSKIGEILNFKDRLLSARGWLFTEEDWAERKAKFDTTINTAEGHLHYAETQGTYILYASLIFLVLIIGIYFKRRIYYGLTLGISVVSIALLGQGVMNPIMEMSATQEDLTIQLYVNADDIPYYEEAVEFLEGVADYIGYADGAVTIVKVIDPESKWVDDLEDFVQGYQQIVLDGKTYLVENKDTEIGIDKVFPGKTYYYYQNKGIMEVISMLWKTDNKPVAIAIGLFSVIIPILKLLSTLIILFSRTTGTKRFRKVLSFLAKWSMADVFVVSLFLAYLSFANMSPGVEMDAQVLFGLYYFMGYVILSISLGFILDASIKERKKHLELTDKV
jgi:hypothetical protein